MRWLFKESVQNIEDNNNMITEAEVKRIKQIIAYYIHEHDIHLRDPAGKHILVSEFSSALANRLVVSELPITPIRDLL
jgi:hypothetical protein